MNAKEYLNQARVLDRRINITLERVSQLRSLTQRITPAYDGEVVSHTRNVTSLQDTIVRLLEAEDLLNSTIDTLVDLKTEISGAVSYTHLDVYKRQLQDLRVRHRKRQQEGQRRQARHVCHASSLLGCQEPLRPAG